MLDTEGVLWSQIFFFFSFLWDGQYRPIYQSDFFHSVTVLFAENDRMIDIDHIVKE